MEIIGDIEKVAREVYCRPIGFISFSGYMDTNIAIRTVTIEAEYEETLAKAQ